MEGEGQSDNKVTRQVTTTTIKLNEVDTISQGKGPKLNMELQVVGQSNNQTAVNIKI